LDRAQRGSAIAAAVAVIFLIGLGLRLEGLDRRTMGHPENYVAGLESPDWSKAPRPRRTLAETWDSVLGDGHPPTYFFATLAWTKLFGTSLFSIRLPSALLGALSILLLFRVARRELPPLPALLASAFLALNGFHLFLSQRARMYAAVTFLGLLSVWMLWRVLESNRPWDRINYVVVTALMLWTQLYAWPLLFAQMMWALLRSARDGASPVALPLQILAVMIGCPVVALSIIQNPVTEWRDLIVEYLNFGFAFRSRAYYWVARPEPWLAREWLSVLGAGLLLLTYWVREPLANLHQHGSVRLSRGFLSLLAITAAVASVGMVAVFQLEGPLRKLYWIASTLPFGLAVGLVLGLRFVDPAPAWLARLGRLAGRPSLWLALLPAACMLTVSLFRPSWVARGAMVFVPYLLIAMAAGIHGIRWRGARIVVALVCLATLAQSVAYFRGAAGHPRDYQGLGRELVARLEPTDAIFVQRDRYVHPPLYYYLTDHFDQLVGHEWSSALEGDRFDRVWVVVYRANPTREHQLPGIWEALEGWEQTDEIRFHRANAWLFEPRTIE
jgi:4-amino-4-deoxy-L-arabinose transferase-like glycosyltransferase